jgi:hypothetical protein
MQITFLWSFQDLITSLVSSLLKLQYDFSLTGWAAVSSVAHLPHKNWGEEESFYLLSCGGLFSYKTRGRNPASERVTLRRTGNGRAVDAIHKKTRAYELKTESAMQRPSVDMPAVLPLFVGWKFRFRTVHFTK